MPRRDERLYIGELIEGIDRILEYTKEGRDAFLSSDMTQDAVTRNLIVIGEAAKNLSAETKAKAPEVPWSEIAGMRDRIVHAYFSIDLEVIWEVVANELTALRSAVEKIKSQM